MFVFEKKRIKLFIHPSDVIILKPNKVYNFRTNSQFYLMRTKADDSK